MAKTPSEHIDAQVEAGLAWLNTGIAVVRGRSTNKELRGLATAAEQAATRAGVAYYALLGKLEALAVEGRLNDDGAEERQLVLPGVQALEQCLVRDDTCQHRHCEPDPLNPICRSFCGIAPAPELEPLPEGWLAFVELALEESYDPETGELIEDGSVTWHRPAMLGAATAKQPAAMSDTARRALGAKLERAQAAAKAARKRGAKPAAKPELEPEPEPDSAEEPAAEAEEEALPWDVYPGDIVLLRWPGTADGSDQKRARVVSVNGLGSGVQRIAVNVARVDRKGGYTGEWGQEMRWVAPEDILDVLEVAP